MPRHPSLPAAAGVLLLLLVVGLGVFTWQLRTVRDGLANARTVMQRATEALEDGDVEAFRAAVADAEEEAAAAGDVSDAMAWGAAARIPVLGRAPRLLRGIVEVTEASVAVAADLGERAEGLVDADGELRLRVRQGAIDVESLRAAEAILAELPLDRVRRAREALRAMDTGLVPPAVASGRAAALDLATGVAGVVEDARRVAGTLPSLLGADGPRRYLLALQNSAELRGTGGLISLVGILEADGGELSLTGPEVVESVSADLQDAGLPAVQAPPEFQDRYGRVGGTRLLNNVNLDPDLPTVAPVVLDLFEQRVGERLDGVIAVDPTGLAELLAVIGPVDIPDELAAPPRIPDPVPPAEIPRVLLVEAYEVYGGDTPERREFQTTVAAAALGPIVSGTWEAPPVMRRLAWAVDERHLQVYATDPAVQERLEEVGAAGRLRTRDRPGWERGDLLAVTANNAAANKQDVHVGHALTYDVDLDLGSEVGDETVAATRAATIGIEVLNPLPTSGRHPWIIGSTPPGGSAEGLTGPPGLNRTWWTTWAPFGTRLISGSGAGGDEIDVRTGAIHQMLAVDEFLETPSEERNRFRLDLSGPVLLQRDGDDLLYRLTLWRQAKAIPDDVTLRVAPPDGWMVAGVETGGGAPGPRLNVSADAVAGSRVLRVDRDGRGVEIGGELGEDLHLEVRLSREALWRRLLPG